MRLEKHMFEEVEKLAREKNVESATVLHAMEDSFALALRRAYPDGRDMDFRVHIDPDSREITAYRRWRVLDEEEPMTIPQAEMMLETARDKKADLNPGDYWEEKMEAPDFSRRVSVQVVKQNITNRLRDAEREQMLSEFLARDEDLVHGTVRRIDRISGEVTVEVLGRVECTLRREDLIPRENLRPGDRIRALVKEVNREGRGPQLLITRVSPEFLMKLFQREVPEIERGTLEIIGAVRDPGNRAKIAVRSHDERVDPVGTCVGIRGSRVQSVTNELNGERVDIIPWEDNPAQFVLKALAPAEVSEIHVNEDEHSMDIVVQADKLAQAIGRNGVNVRLASELTGWRINLTSPEDFEQKSQSELDAKSRVFVERLDVDPEVARVLVEEGFENLEQIAYVPREDMLSIADFDEETVDELRKRAREEVERIEADTAEKMKNVDPALAALEGMDDAALRALVRGDVLTIAALADMDTEEFMECTGERDEERAGALIMAAREIVFAAEDAAEDAAGDAAEDAAGDATDSARTG